MSCTNTFWIHHIKQLVCDFSLIPSTDDSLEVSMNKITRMAIILSVVIMFFSIKSGVVVLVITFIFIMSFYYGNKSRPAGEGYTEINTGGDPTPATVIPQLSPFNEHTSGRFCNDCDSSASNDPDYISKNQLLTGFGNPKTRVQPIVAPPSHDLDSWAENGLVKRSQINDKKNFDLYRSGFSSAESYSEPRKCMDCMYVPCMCATMKKVSAGKRRTSLLERFEDHVNTNCVFDPSVSSTESNTSYKDRLLTQTIQPGVYQKNNVGEPVNSMIGISFQQQFLPTAVQQNSDEIKFTQHNPDNVPLHLPKYEEDVYIQNYSNIYDPRFTGYGDQYRTYEEPVTGQTRFFYKDVDAIKMPNYLVRSKVDTLQWAPTYGPDKPFQGDYLEHRKLANNAFHDSALVFRTEMQERLMRKRNAEMWQRRVAPISTNQQLGLGANKSCL